MASRVGTRIGEAKLFETGRVNWWGRDPDWEDKLGFRGRQDVESRDGDWTRIEAVCAGDTLEYFVNGKLVNKASGLSHNSGKLIFQSEGAGDFFRRIELHPPTPGKKHQNAPPPASPPFFLGSRTTTNPSFPPHNKNPVVVAFSSQPRVGSAVTDEMSLIEICRPRVFGLFTSICFGSQVCWLIFWCGAGL